LCESRHHWQIASCLNWRIAPAKPLEGLDTVTLADNMEA
jgi:hypothetical protein